MMTGVPFLPSEMLPLVLRNLDPLTLLASRQVNSRFKASVDGLPQYRTFSTLFRKTVQLYQHSYGPGVPHGWTLDAVRQLFDISRRNIEVIEVQKYYIRFKRLHRRQEHSRITISFLVDAHSQLLREGRIHEAEDLLLPLV